MPATFGLLRLLAWSGWRAAIPLHALRAAWSAIAGDYPGLFLLGILVATEGFSPRTLVGVISALCGVGLGILWGARGNAKVAEALAHSESAKRSWRDPSPFFGILGAVVAAAILTWLVVAYLFRPFEATWPVVLPGLLLLVGTMFSVNDLTIAVSLRAAQAQTNRTVQVSLDNHGALLYRLSPAAHKVRRG